jgi:Zn-dependent M28 family amino/carboxypeptidase
MFDLTLIQPLLSRIDPEALRRTVETLPAPRAAGDPGRTETAGLIEQRLRTAGWSVRRQEYTVDLGPGANVIARRTGTRCPEALYVVGAHYDTVPGSPGADDNGSAIAGLLALAEALRGVSLEATVELAAFDLEEYGFLGSHQYVGELLRRDGADRSPRRLEGALILEMIGCRSRAPHSQKIPTGFDYLYPEQVRSILARGRRGDFLALVSSLDSRALAASVAATMAAAEPELPIVPIEAPEGSIQPQVLYLSDHVPFWSAGLPALQFTDSAFLRNPHYHQPTDTPETLDYDFAAAITRGVLAALCQLAGVESAA